MTHQKLFRFGCCFILFFLGVVGCSEEASRLTQKPDIVIETDALKKILIDIHIAEAYSQSLELDSTIHIPPIDEYYQQIFEIHETNYEDFQTSLQYYTNFPDSIQQIYEDMLNILAKMEPESRKKGVAKNKNRVQGTNTKNKSVESGKKAHQGIKK